MSRMRSSMNNAQWEVRVVSSKVISSSSSSSSSGYISIMSTMSSSMSSISSVSRRINISVPVWPSPHRVWQPAPVGYICKQTIS